MVTNVNSTCVGEVDGFPDIRGRGVSSLKTEREQPRTRR